MYFMQGMLELTHPSIQTLLKRIYSQIKVVSDRVHRITVDSQRLH